jgi:hypothetical protein
MTNDYGVLFPTSVVGSMPRPDFVRDLISEDSVMSDEDYDKRIGSRRGATSSPFRKTPAWDIVTRGRRMVAGKATSGVIADMGARLRGRHESRRTAGSWTIVTGIPLAQGRRHDRREVKFASKKSPAA